MVATKEHTESHVMWETCGAGLQNGCNFLTFFLKWSILCFSLQSLNPHYPDFTALCYYWFTSYIRILLGTVSTEIELQMQYTDSTVQHCWSLLLGWISETHLRNTHKSLFAEGKRVPTVGLIRFSLSFSLLIICFCLFLPTLISLPFRA